MGVGVSVGVLQICIMLGPLGVKLMCTEFLSLLKCPQRCILPVVMDAFCSFMQFYL